MATEAFIFKAFRIIIVIVNGMNSLTVLKCHKAAIQTNRQIYHTGLSYFDLIWSVSCLLQLKTAGYYKVVNASCEIFNLNNVMSCQSYSSLCTELEVCLQGNHWQIAFPVAALTFFSNFSAIFLFCLLCKSYWPLIPIGLLDQLLNRLLYAITS